MNTGFNIFVMLGDLRKTDPTLSQYNFDFHSETCCEEFHRIGIIKNGDPVSIYSFITRFVKI